MTHLHSRKGAWSRTYYTWASMVQRCTNPARNNWKIYGGRGISIDPAWLKFDVFLADMGERPEGTSLDRIDPNGNYELRNCTWVDRKTQSRNRRNNKLVVEDAERIKEMLLFGAVCSFLGKIFDVSKQQILHIKHGRQWA